MEPEQMIAKLRKEIAVKMRGKSQVEAGPEWVLIRHTNGSFASSVPVAYDDVPALIEALKQAYSDYEMRQAEQG